LAAGEASPASAGLASADLASAGWASPEDFEQPV